MNTTPLTTRDEVRALLKQVLHKKIGVAQAEEQLNELLIEKKIEYAQQEVARTLREKEGL